MTPVERTLIERLQQAGATGLDLSPGDPLCREAAARLQSLEQELERLKKDKERMDFLEAEQWSSSGAALYRQNNPITREVIDTARRTAGDERG